MLFYFTQHRIIYNKMVGYLSIFLQTRFGHWDLEIGNYLEFGISCLEFFLFRRFDTYLLGQADQFGDRVNAKLLHDTAFP
jgi:hypothetical protein